jgi:methionyl-tRNA formyltransferase
MGTPRSILKGNNRQGVCLKRKIEITLFLGQDKGLASLDYLLSRPDVEVMGVFVSRDSKVREDFSSQIISLAGDKFCSEEEFEFSNAEGFALAVGYRKMIRWPEGKLVVLHDSLLPKYRGFSPLPSMLINGERKIGVTAFIANDDFDSGDVVAKSWSRIAYPTSLRFAMDLNMQNYVRCTSKVVDKILKPKSRLLGAKQNSGLATYSLWRDQEDYQIDWSMEARQILRFIDAVGEPYDGAKAKIQSRTIRITRATYAGNVKIENLTAGKVIWWSKEFPLEKRRPTVACGRGLIQILDAHYEDTGESIFPTPSFRLRFS